MADGLASCLAGCLPSPTSAWWLIYLLPSSPDAWQAACPVCLIMVRLWAQNSLFCKAGDCSVGILFSSNLECPMKQKFPSQQALVISLQHLSMYSVHGNLDFLRLKKHLTGNACIICAWFISASQIALYRFSLAKSKKNFRQACNVILITGSIFTELSYSPNHKVLINCNIDSWKIIMMMVLDMWPKSVPIGLDLSLPTKNQRYKFLFVIKMAGVCLFSEYLTFNIPISF